MSSEVMEAAPADPLLTPDLIRGLLRSAAGRGDLHACLSRLRSDAHGVAPLREGGDFPFAAPLGRDRSENLAQTIGNIQSTPGNADVAADGSPPRDDREVSAPAGADPAPSQGAPGSGCEPAEPFAFERCDGPQNPEQPPDNIDSAPEPARPAVAAGPNDVALILTPTGWKPMRMLQNGMAA